MQTSCCIQQASRPSHGFSPGHPVYRIPQYFPYLRNGGTSKNLDSHVLLHSFARERPAPASTPMLRARVGIT
nr:hypothetical protein Iba_chr06bCG13200 [Ipomoea batatas]